MLNYLFMYINFAEIHFCFIILLILMVIFLKNPIHALLCFIFAVINILSIFIMFQAEFVALILFLVYVGAIAILFLALIMFLNLSYLFYNELEKRNHLFAKIEKFLLFLFFALIFWVLNYNIFIFYIQIFQESNILLGFQDVYSISYLLYTDFSFFIFFSGVLLFLTTIITMIYTTLPKIISVKFIRDTLLSKKS